MAQPQSLFIKTTQVHDWCCKNSSTTLTLADLVFPVSMADVAGVECDLLNFTCSVLARSQPVNGVTVITLRKQASFRLTFVTGSGEPVPVTVEGRSVPSQNRTRFWDEFVKIAAPATAEISCELTDAGCRTALAHSGGVPVVNVELYDVQSLTAEESVRMQVTATEIMRPARAKKSARPMNQHGGV